MAADEINYRRFFDINELAAIRVEDPTVFAAVHELPLELVRERDGHRPAHRPRRRPVRSRAVLRDLRSACAEAVGAGEAPRTGRLATWWSRRSWCPTSGCPPSGRSQGTTGYEFLNLLSGVLVDGAAGDRLRGHRAPLRRRARALPDVVYDGKKLILGVGDVRRADRAGPPAGPHLGAAPLHPGLHPQQPAAGAVGDHRLLPRLPHLHPPEDGYVGERDRPAIETAIRAAKRRNPVIDESLFDFVRRLLLLDDPTG